MSMPCGSCRIPPADRATRCGSLAIRRERALLTLILVDAAADPGERPDGNWWGSNAWLADGRDQRCYGEAEG